MTMSEHKCHLCDQSARWQIMASKWERQEALSGWFIRTNRSSSVAQVCEQHLVERLSDNSAYHLVYRLDAASAPDGVDWSRLIEECHIRNLSFYSGRESFLGP